MSEYLEKIENSVDSIFEAITLRYPGAALAEMKSFLQEIDTMDRVGYLIQVLRESRRAWQSVFADSHPPKVDTSMRLLDLDNVKLYYQKVVNFAFEQNLPGIALLAQDQAWTEFAIEVEVPTVPLEELVF